MSEAPIAAEPPLAEGTDGTEGTAGSQGAEGFRRSEGLDAHLVVRRGDFRLDVSLTAAPGDVVALLGPNGAGKTTALRALAGLTPLTGGHLRLDGAALERTAPESRPVGVVFQDYLLFPHLTALDNIAFGPRCQGLGKAAARAQAAEWLDRMGLAEYSRHQAAPPLRRPGPARRPRPRPRHPPPPAAPGRAPRRPGRPYPPRRTGPTPPPPRRVRCRRRTRHPRSPRRHGPGRPPRRGRTRPSGPGGHPGRHRPPPPHGLHRPPGRPEPVPGAVRGPRRTTGRAGPERHTAPGARREQR